VRLYAPSLTPSSLSLFFAAGVTRRRLCDGSGIDSEGGSGGPTSVCSDQLFDPCGAEPVLDLLTGAWLAGRSLALARSRSSASVSGPGKRFE
jgi:hypothetical protein